MHPTPFAIAYRCESAAAVPLNSQTLHDEVSLLMVGQTLQWIFRSQKQYVRC